MWQPAECIHAGICFGQLRQVFNPVKRPWVDINGDSCDKIIEVVKRCPTRALTYMWQDEERNAADQSDKIFREDLSKLFLESSITPPNDPTVEVKSGKVTIRPGGPMLVEGDFTISFDGKELRSMKMASLCRCGLSGDQPFCDGAHFKAGFRG